MPCFASTARRCLLVALVALLAACDGSRPAVLPFSGASGFRGGSEDTIYYDRDGRPHFQN